VLCFNIYIQATAIRLKYADYQINSKSYIVSEPSQDSRLWLSLHLNRFYTHFPSYLHHPSLLRPTNTAPKCASSHLGKTHPRQLHSLAFSHGSLLRRSKSVRVCRWNNSTTPSAHSLHHIRSPCCKSRLLILVSSRSDDL